MLTRLHVQLYELRMLVCICCQPSMNMVHCTADTLQQSLFIIYASYIRTMVMTVRLHQVGRDNYPCLFVLSLYHCPKTVETTLDNHGNIVNQKNTSSRKQLWNHCLEVFSSHLLQRMRSNFCSIPRQYMFEESTRLAETRSAQHKFDYIEMV